MKVLVDAQQGYAFITVFTAKEQLEGEVPVYRIWDMGDGTSYEDITSVQHIYKFAGVYTIQYSILDSAGIKYFVTFEVNVLFAVHDSIVFTQIPTLYADPGQPSNIFTVSVTSTQIDKPIAVSLFAVNSNSIPAQVVDSKWEKLVPRWRFVEATKNILKGEYTAITELNSIVTPLTTYNTLNEVVTYAVAGDVSFRFIDDTSTGIPHKSLPLLLNATLQTSSFTSPRDSYIYNYESYANSSVISTTVAWQVNYVKTSFLKITSNIYENITHLNWKNISIPFVITSHVSPTFLTQKQDTGISYVYPSLSAITNIGMLTSYNGVDFTPLQSAQYTLTPGNITFSSLDAQGVRAGGYVFGSIQGDFTGAYVKLSAYTSAVNTDRELFVGKNEFVYPMLYTPIPIAYICNPIESTVTKLHITPLASLDDVNLKNSIIGTVKTYSTFISAISSDIFNYRIPYDSGTYCVAVDPNDTNSPYSSVVVDAANDIVYRFKTVNLDGTETTQTSSVHLSSFSEFNAVTQNVNTASISLDSQSNIWLSLNNSTEILKLDQDFKFLTRISLPQDILVSEGVTGVLVDQPSEGCNCHCDDGGDGGVADAVRVVYDTGDFSVRSKVIETDQNDNIWVGCVVPNGSVILKYSKSGVLLLRYDLPLLAVIDSFTIDYYNNLWLTYHTRAVNYGNSILLKLSQSATLLHTQNLNQKYATYLCVDRQSNLWYIHGGRSFGFVNTLSNSTLSWDIDKNGEITYTPNNLLKTSNLNNDFNSITIDAFDRLWLVDSTHNNVVCFSSYTQLLTSLNATKISINIKPDTDQHHYITYNNLVSSVTLPEGKNIYAVGDFTGNKWLQKYGDRDTNITVLTGESAVFSIQDLYDNMFQMRKVNENFNMTEYFKTVSVTDAFLSYESLYSSIFTPIVGDNTTLKNNIGLRVYEKIANFGSNTADIDTCEIQHLVSLAKMTGNDILRVDRDIPVGIKRLLDIVSIPANKLLGSIEPDEEISNTMYTTNVFLEEKATLTQIVTCTQLLAFVSDEDSSISLVTVPVLSTSYFGQVEYLSAYSLETYYNTNTYFSSGFKAYILDADSDSSNILYKLEYEDQIKTNNALLLVDKQISKKTVTTVPLSSYLHSDNSTVIYISSMKFKELYNFQEGCFYYDRYHCYMYLTHSTDISSSKHFNNTLDWTNTYNTINYNSLKTDKNLWYGDNGIIESAFNNILTRYLTVTSELVE